eukprot:gene5756-11631_t
MIILLHINQFLALKPEMKRHTLVKSVTKMPKTKLEIFINIFPKIMELNEPVDNDDALFDILISDLLDGEESLRTGYSDDWMDETILHQDEHVPLKQESPIGSTLSTHSVTNFVPDKIYLDDFCRPPGILDDDDDDEDVDDYEDHPPKDWKRKRKRPFNPDAEIIAEATERNLKLLNLDPNSKEGKKQKRKIRNRMSAQMHRERKKAYIETLEGMVRERNLKINELQNSLRSISLENERLRGQLNMLVPDEDSEMGRHHNVAIPLSNDFQSHMTDGTTTSSSTNNSDNYDSDASHSSVSVSSPTRPNSSLLRAGLSLFSFLSMLSITVLRDPSTGLTNSILSRPYDMTTTSTYTDISSDLSSAITHHLPHFHLQLGGDVSSPPSSKQLSLPGTFPVDTPSSSSSSSSSYDHKGRILFSTSTSTKSTDNYPTDHRPLMSSSEYPKQTQTQTYRELPLPHVALPAAMYMSSPSSSAAASMSTSKALWKYQNRLVQLFPQLPSEALDDNIYSAPLPRTTTKKTTTTMTKKNGNLRSRSRQSQSQPQEPVYDNDDQVNIDESNGQGQGSGQFQSTSGALVLAGGGAPLTWSGSGSVDEHLMSQGSISRVLMTHGRALLDQTLLSSTSTSTSTAIPPHPRRHPSDDASSVTPFHDLPYTPPPITVSPHDSRRSDVIPTIIAVDPASYKSPPLSTSPPVLMMLLPASAIRSGNAWDEGSNGPLADILKNLEENEYKSSGYAYTAPGSGFGTGFDGYEDQNSTGSVWVEIGCTVFRAQLETFLTCFIGTEPPTVIQRDSIEYKWKSLRSVPNSGINFQSPQGKYPINHYHDSQILPESNESLIELNLEHNHGDKRRENAKISPSRELYTIKCYIKSWQGVSINIAHSHLVFMADQIISSGGPNSKQPWSLTRITSVDCVRPSALLVSYADIIVNIVVSKVVSIFLGGVVTNELALLP